MASTIFWRVIRNDEHLHLALRWHPAVEPPPKREPFKRGFFPIHTNHTRCICGDRFLRGPRNSQGGTTGPWFPAFSSVSKPIGFVSRSRLRSDGVSFAATLAACEKCHWAVDAMGERCPTPAMPIWKSLKGNEFEFPYIDSFKSFFFEDLKQKEFCCVLSDFEDDGEGWTQVLFSPDNCSVVLSQISRLSCRNIKANWR